MGGEAFQPHGRTLCIYQQRCPFVPVRYIIHINPETDRRRNELRSRYLEFPAPGVLDGVHGRPLQTFREGSLVLRSLGELIHKRPQWPNPTIRDPCVHCIRNNLVIVARERSPKHPICR